MRVLLLIVFMLCSLPYFKVTQTESYTDVVQNIQSEKERINTLYKVANAAARDSIVRSTRQYLNQSISTQLFPFWYGTPWDFNGTTRTPGEGKIACGYFVTNVLTDAGFNIPRVKWAQSASEVFIKKLAPRNIKRFSGASLSKVKAYLLEEGEGLYLIGLDMHVGFLLVECDKISFIHSNYYQPDIGVTAEDIDANSPLSTSHYRVIGKLMSDEMVKKWINDVNY